MRNKLITIALICTSLAIAFIYSGYYCLNSGEPDLAEGLIMTFGVPFFIGAFIALCGVAATPVGSER